jgi:DNA gyrase/topoisomerase IV subunit B
MSEIEKLSEFQHARRRTEMYLGSKDPHTQVVLEYRSEGPYPTEFTWVPAVFTSFREIFDNAVDEVVAHGHGDRIDISFDPSTYTFVIEDNGRGIPIDFDEGHGRHLATVALCETRAGRNFNDATRGSTRGLNGVGASVVNFVSEYFVADILRDGKHFSQRFEEGGEHVIKKPSIKPQKKKLPTTGTRIEFKLSEQVFKHRILPESFLRARIFEAALCYPGLRIYYNGERVSAKSVEKDLFPKRKPIIFTIEEKGFKSQFWLVPDFFENGAEHVHGLVNAIPVFNGGVHIDTFRRNFAAGILTALEGQSKRRRLQPNRSDLVDGMLIYNITQMDAPHFDSQAKTRLINEGVGKIVTNAMDDPDFYKGVIRRNPEWIERIYERCSARTEKKDAADLARISKKNLRAKVENLKDASGMDRSKCILFLGEGNSAISGMVEARKADLHGGLPLRGKVLNVFGVPMKDVVQNDTLSKIMTAVGLVPGQRVNRHVLRYGKVYIATDADEDGHNICALLINFFYTLWPELFDPQKPFLYVFDTPLIIAVKGKERRYWYSDNYHDFNSEKLGSGWEITRAKGLAALKKADWIYSLENPKVVPVIDDGSLAESLNLVFNKGRADDRKDWIGL